MGLFSLGVGEAAPARSVCSECRLKLQKSTKRVSVNAGGQLLKSACFRSESDIKCTVCIRSLFQITQHNFSIIMVNSDNEIQVLKNGGKSQPNSPITLAAPGGGKTQGSESSEDEREGTIRVGRDYQAVPPPFIPKQERRSDQCQERALLVWSPSANIANQKREIKDQQISVNVM